VKYKMIALILALTVVSGAQTATQTAPAAPQQNAAPAEKEKCPCCDKIATSGAKDAAACCAHHAQHDAQGKETASCCSGKDAKSCCGGADAKSCMKSDKDKAACCSACCGKDKTAASCGGNCGKDAGCCCSAKKSEKTAQNRCGHDSRS